MRRAAVVLAVAGLSAYAVPPVPMSPDNAEVAEEWSNPAVRAGEGERATVEVLEAPAAVSAHDPFHVKLRVTNRTDEALDGLAVLARRAAPVASLGEQRVAAVAGVGEYGVVGGRKDVDTRLLPGASTELEMDLGLDLAAVGTYPVALQLLDDASATLDTDRFHIAVRGVRDNVRAGGMTALYPISAPVDVVPGETGEAPENPPLVLASETLAGELAPDGRLSRLVDEYLDAAAAPQVGYATCVALDPALVDTVDRMAGGYTVDDERPTVVEEPKRLRDSWGGARDTHGEPGAGADDAKVWLDKVRRIAATGCTVALPWANADLGAVARTGDPWLMREAVERGPFVLERVLGTAGTLNTVVSGTGYVEAGTAPALGWADHLRSTIMDEGMQGAWERAHAADEDTPEGAGTSESALDRAELADLAGAAAPAPTHPVQVLAAGEPHSFGWLAPGVMQVGYQDSLATILAATGQAPETTGTSSTDLRFDYSEDSKAARDVSAAAAVRLAAQSAWAPADAPETEAEPEPEPAPVFVAPPATWDADTAAVVLGAIADLLASGASRAVSLGDYLRAPADVQPAEPADVVDPAAYTDAEILQVTQQAAFINDLTALMVPDPAIALTRYGFTLPLRRDLLTALTVGTRRARLRYDDNVSATSARLAGSRAALNELRSAVTLIPPGNVYTRTSASSPLLIVARNGLPLPVETRIGYSGPQGARLNVPGMLKVPARGSVTVQMTADLPETGRGSQLQLYLTSASGQPISQPVEIAVRTSGVTAGGWLVAGAAVLATLAVLALVRGRRGPPRAQRQEATQQRERRRT